MDFLKIVKQYNLDRYASVIAEAVILRTEKFLVRNVTLYRHHMWQHAGGKLIRFQIKNSKRAGDVCWFMPECKVEMFFFNVDFAQSCGLTRRGLRLNMALQNVSFFFDFTKVDMFVKKATFEEVGGLRNVVKYSSNGY